MSGPKTADYSVVDNRATAAAARAQAWAAAGEIEARLNALLDGASKAAREFGFAPVFPEGLPTRPASSARAIDIETFVAGMRAAVSQVEIQVERAIIAKQTARMLSALVVGVSGKLTTAAEALSGRTPSSYALDGSDTAPSAEARRELIQRALDRLEGTLPPEEWKSIQRLAGDAIEVSEKVRFENLAMELQYRIQRANKLVREVQADKHRASQLLVTLRGLLGTDVEEISGELKRVELGECALPLHIEQRVEAISQAARRRADRDYAGRVIREEFERLGYQVDQGFQTIFVDGGTIRLQRPEMKEYHARLRVSSADQRLDFQVVRAGNIDEEPTQERRVRDHEMEDQWCADLAQVMAAVKRQNVHSRITQRIPAGGQAVTVDDVGRSAKHRRDEEDQLSSRRV